MHNPLCHCGENEFSKKNIEKEICEPLALIPLQIEQHCQLCPSSYWPSPETNKIDMLESITH